MTIDKLRELDRAMTPGEWTVELDGAFNRRYLQRSNHVDGIPFFNQREEDMEAIATLRNALPAIIARLEAADALAEDCELHRDTETSLAAYRAKGSP